MKYEKGSFITVPTSSIVGIGVGPQALYMWLCSFANNSGECFPSRSTLAERLGCSERAVDGYIDELIRLGLLIKEQRFSKNKQISNNYYLPLGGAKSARGVAESAPTPSQNLRTELNPVVTQSTKLYTVSETEREKRPTYSESQGYDTKATQRLLKHSEEFIGHKWPAEGKQKRFIADILRAGFKEEKVWACFVSLGDDEFWGPKGYDWATVSSQIGKVKKTKAPIKSYGVKK